MNAGIAAYVILTQNTDVTNIVGVNIFPEVAEQETATPFIVYQLLSVAPEDTHDGPSKLDEVRFEFLCYADSYALAADLGSKVRGALDRVSGTYNGVNVESIQFNDVDIDTIDAPRRFAQVLTFTFRIKRDNVEIAQGTPVTGAKLGDLYDVDTTGVTDGQVIAYDAAAQEWQPADDAGGVTELGQLDDVDIIAPEQGDVLSYNAGVQEWMVNGGLQELLARFKASGTGAQVYDTLNDTTKGYIDILAASATMKVNHSGLTISEASPGVLSFSVAAGTEGNEVEFEAMTIEGSDAISTLAEINFKQGALTYWENATGKIWLRAPNAGNITVLLPSSGGTLALTTDIPNVPVDSVNGQTGVVVLDTGDIDENGNLYYTEARVAANAAVVANTAKVGVIAGGTTGQALVKASGTDYDTEWADIAIDTQYHDRFATDAETFRSGATATTELYYTAKADGDGLAQSASSDTPTAGKVIKRKIYYSEAAFADPDTGTWVEFTPAPADDASFATVKAALLEYLKARTGGTVPISLKQTWEEETAAPSFTGLLNESYGSGAEAAYSTRRLNGNVTECMVIRRASDSTTTTIGFDGSGNISEADIETFCTGTTCTVSSWIDQSGNGNDATQATPANQPTIYTGGSLVKENGKVALDFDGSNDALTNTNLTTNSNETFTIVANYNNASSSGTLFDSAQTDEHTAFLIQSEFRAKFGSNTDMKYGDAATGQKLHWIYKDNTTSSSSYGAIDGGATDALNAGTNNANGITLGNNRVSSFSLNGQMQELILFGENKSSVRTDIEENVGDYFTQNTPLLDTYSGAAAAYSLRLLDSTYTGDAVEVYNGSSYANVGFNVFGELDTVALAAHCGSNDGFVSKWYDQSGNTNTAAQTATASMPKIYDGTTGVVTENGKPAVIGVSIDSQLSLSSSISFTDFCLIHVYEEITNNKMTWCGNSNQEYYYHAGVNHRINGMISFAHGLTTNAQTLDFANRNAGSIEVHLNGSSVATSTYAASYSFQHLFNRSTGGFGYEAPIQEFILYTSEQSDNRTEIETNINAFYSIY